MNGNTRAHNFFFSLSLWSRIRPWRCCASWLLCGRRVMVSPPSWIPLQTLSESLLALWVCSTLKIIPMLGCKHIKLAKSNLRNKNNEILVLTLVSRLGLPENHRELVSKCKVPLTTILIMNKHGSSFSLSINMEPGLQEPFKVILQLSMSILFFFFFWGERAQSFHQILTKIHDSGKFKGNWFIYSQTKCMFAEGEIANLGSKNIKVFLRAIIYKGFWLLVSDSPKYYGVKKEFLNSLYVASSLFLQTKSLFRGF